MRNERLDELAQAVAQSLAKVRELAQEGALPPVLQALTLIAPPRGWLVQVELRPYEDGGDGRRDGWDPRNGEVAIAYAPRRGEWRDERPQHDDRAHDGWREAPREPLAPPDGERALRDVAAVVLGAEREGTYKFLALKFLRDQLLPRHVEWALAPHEAQIQINRAIESGVLRTTKVENPRQPLYPVTAVELNRENPIVAALIGESQARAQGDEDADEGERGEPPGRDREPGRGASAGPADGAPEDDEPS